MHSYKSGLTIDLMIRGYSRNLGQHSNLARKKRYFLKKGTKNVTPLYLIPFLSLLHQNKALKNFWKRRQCLIVEHNIGLEYALMIKPSL